MSKIDDLINKLCPNGVEYKYIPEIADTFIGLVTTMTKHYVKNGVPLIHNSDIKEGRFEFKEFTYLDYEFAEKNNNRRHKLNDVITVHTGDVGTSAIIDESLDGSLGFATIVSRIKNFDIIIPKYLCAFLNSHSCKLQIQSMIKGDRNNLNLKDFNQLMLPVPPLEVQHEIVHILDDFTLLSAELSAELTARQKQYDYYVEKILSSINADTVTVGEACDTITDFVAAGSFGDIAKNVKYLNEPDYAQLIRTVDIKNKFKKSDYIYVDENAFNYLWRVNLNKECIILPNIGVNCGEVYYITPNDLIYKNNVLGPNAILLRSSKNNNRYLSYVFKTHNFQKQLRKIISPAGQTKFNKTELKKLEIKLPSIDVQTNIANKIEKMDKIVNDITDGLPAEIEARQKQYEYYRDKLLTFKEISVKED